MVSGVPASSRTVSWTPLVLALGQHLLLVLAWWLRPGVQLPGLAPTERTTMLVMVKPPPRSSATSRSLPRPPAVTRARPPTLPAQPAQPANPDAVFEPQPTPPPAETEAAPAPMPGGLLDASRRMAGRIARELPADSSPITAEPDRKWERFAGMVAGARVDAGRSVSLDSYTASDGVTIYRKTVGGRARCYMSGSVGGLGPADGHSAGNVPCPPGVRWTRL
ncbi:hypothetical protein ACSUZJ_15930 [Telluria sp. B2]